MSKLSQAELDALVSMELPEVKEALQKIDGTAGLLKAFGTDPDKGLTTAQVEASREQYGENVFPEAPLKTYLEFLLDTFNDTTLLVLLVAACVSLVVGIVEEGTETGWIEGVAIYIAVILVSNIGAINDYSKQFQFAELEKTAADDDTAVVMRNGEVLVVNPREVVVGDLLVLNQGDAAPADCIIISNNTVYSNQSTLTGEPDDIKKSATTDPVIFSSCTVPKAGATCYAVSIGIGMNSAWGKIKSSTAVEHADTPLQEKLNTMTEMIGYVGLVSAVLTFIVMVINIWARDNGEHIGTGFTHAAVLAITIVVVAIPEGLPLAVTIALAYSTGEMYKQQCNIRHLAACETMGNATNICSDKTGTLTENQMSVVAGYFDGRYYDHDAFEKDVSTNMNEDTKECIANNTCINRDCHIRWVDEKGVKLFKPEITGSKTESALMLMTRTWGYVYTEVMENSFKKDHDVFYAFNSSKKRSAALVHRPDGSIRVYVKGASEWIMKDCTMISRQGKAVPLDSAGQKEVADYIEEMASHALRTLALAHVDFPNEAALPAGWQEDAPDSANLTLDCIVGIIDPLRSDVKMAVKTAQEAGVTVRMITGDNISTAKAIARQCGILTEGGSAIEGPAFRKLTPAEADVQLKHIQVMGRSSPEDKLLLVTRLNGGVGLPDDQAAWETLHPESNWDAEKDKLMPGYREEWRAAHPEGGEVVGVTGDGTNDAPALTAADVGLAMGITGTKVAQGAADIVILDDKFSSIVNAIKWGRNVFDNIRKFLQFQITVNIVALIVVFIGACAGIGTPLTAVQMLWVNLIMDTLGALALATEKPIPELLQRKPYKREAPLISWPMWRNILVQGAYQLALLFALMFGGAAWFSVRDMSTSPCFEYKHTGGSGTYTYGSNTITCSDWDTYCKGKGDDCYEQDRTVGGSTWSYEDYGADFKKDCLSCVREDYTHGTIIFNAFIWCQIFNEYTARNIFDEVNPFRNIWTNPMFAFVSIFSVGAQVLIVEVGESFTSTSPLTGEQWGWTIFLGWISMIFGVLMRYIPVEEDPNTFFNSDGPQGYDGDDFKREKKEYSAVAKTEAEVELPSKI